jgi:hypothetical protein
MKRTASINLAQAVRVNEYLKRVLRHLDNGLYEYINGESDLNVAERFDCSKRAVENIRKEMYGSLQVKTPYGIESRTRLDGFEIILRELVNNHNSLLELLERNHGIPCDNLKLRH